MYSSKKDKPEYSHKTKMALKIAGKAIMKLSK